MLFSSWIYVIFLTIVALLYWQLPQRFRIPLLLIGSYIFYMSWSPPFGLIYGPVIFLDSLYFYGLGKAMQKWPQIKKQLLIFGITSELMLLGYFKYSKFLYHNLEHLAHWFDIQIPHLEISLFLPLAISFTNFILISYLVDVYRGDERQEQGFMRFATYVAFFPHLIAGPIVRAKELLHQLENSPQFNPQKLMNGIKLFLLGLGLKLYVADIAAPYVNMIYSTPHLQGFDTSWVATYSFAIQIFCDFWGYTLMAQGSAQILGLSLPQNFNAPYFSANITDFWRRWHISLSRWLKDYLYIPLGGSRCSKSRTYLNLFITMGLGGLWHGASWNFVIWGLYQGLMLSLHKFASFFKLTKILNKPLSVLITFHVVCIGWVFFRAGSFRSAIHILSTMFNPLTTKSLLYDVEGALNRPNPLYFNGVNALSLVCLFMVIHYLSRRYKFQQLTPRTRDWLFGLCCILLLFLSMSMSTDSQEFIYFQF